MKVYTRDEAARLIDGSEGQVIDVSKPEARGLTTLVRPKRRLSINHHAES